MTLSSQCRSIRRCGPRGVGGSRTGSDSCGGSGVAGRTFTPHGVSATGAVLAVERSARADTPLCRPRLQKCKSQLCSLPSPWSQECCIAEKMERASERANVCAGQLPCTVLPSSRHWLELWLSGPDTSPRRSGGGAGISISLLLGKEKFTLASASGGLAPRICSSHIWCWSTRQSKLRQAITP